MCDAKRCVGASLSLSEEGDSVEQYNAIDDDKENGYYHALDAKTCTAVGIFEYDEGLVDTPDVTSYEAAVDPNDNNGYARCVM